MVMSKELVPELSSCRRAPVPLLLSKIVWSMVSMLPPSEFRASPCPPPEAIPFLSRKLFFIVTEAFSSIERPRVAFSTKCVLSTVKVVFP